MRAARKAAAPASMLALGGCAGWQSALDPQGPQASDLAYLVWLFVGVCSAVWVLVMLMLVFALLRRRRDSSDEPLATVPRTERRMTAVVAIAVAATVVIITALTIVSFLTTRGLATQGKEILIRMRGYQWWWELTYVDWQPNRTFLTANEIHVPVGRPVRVELSAGDVIHSFWVPNLAGKQDLIPGRDNSITFTAQNPGIYRGQCAEYCGLQHAHMAFIVVAEPPDAYEAWRTAQLASTVTPIDAEQAKGRLLFETKACAACHTVRGTTAAGSLGPDLTHVASRRTIAAGLLETTRGSLAAWIADPQTLKPGSNMPMVPLDADELRAISAYMASLK